MAGANLHRDKVTVIWHSKNFWTRMSAWLSHGDGVTSVMSIILKQERGILCSVTLWGKKHSEYTCTGSWHAQEWPLPETVNPVPGFLYIYALMAIPPLAPHLTWAGVPVWLLHFHINSLLTCLWQQQNTTKAFGPLSLICETCMKFQVSRFGLAQP